MILWALFAFGGSFDFSKAATNRAADVEARAAAVERSVLAELDELRNVELDARLFESEEFRGLKDWSVPLGDPVVGRSNPFAPAAP